MKKLSSFLLTLALIFGAIAIFEAGARYGATNMRAHAIANELQLSLSTYISGQSTMNEASAAQWTMLINNDIATGAIHRQIWYLNKGAKAQLDKVLIFALSVHGDATAKHFGLIAKSDQPDGLSQAQLNKIRTAIDEAKVELIDNAPELKEVEEAETNDIKSGH